MFAGHFAVALGGKRLVPQVSLGALFLAAQLADVIWPTLVLAGVEAVEIRPGATAMTPLEFTHYPWSHSLAALAIWGALFGGGYALAHRAGFKAAIVLATVVVSHWVLDVVTHARDVPLGFSGAHLLGLGLWRSVPATFAVEAAMFIGGIVIYTRTTAARDRVGSLGLRSLLGLIAVIYVSSALGPPPPTAAAVAWADQAQWLLIAWAWWVDSHRDLRAAVG